VRVNLAESALHRQDDHHQRQLAALSARHADQLQQVVTRCSEVEMSFLTYRQNATAELAELAVLRHEISRLQGQPYSASRREQPDVQLLQTNLADIERDKLRIEEQLKHSENMRVLLERENAESRAELARLRGNVREEAIKQFEEARRPSLDEADAAAGAVAAPKKTALFDPEGRSLRGATPTKLIEHLLDPTATDSLFMQTFLLTYPSFMTGREVMNKIVEMHRRLADKSAAAGRAGSAPVHQPPGVLRVVNTLKYWMEGYWSDFVDDASLLEDVHAIMARLTDDTLAGILRNAIERRKSGTAAPTASTDRNTSTAPRPILSRPTSRPSALDLLSLTPSLGGSTIPPQPSSASTAGGDGASHDRSSGVRATASLLRSLAGVDDARDTAAAVRPRILEFDPLELARQLTLIEADLFARVKGREFVGLAWTKEDKAERAPNLLRMNQWSNHVVHWLISELVAVRDTGGSGGVRLRAQVLERVIVFGQCLDKLNNLNGVKEVTAALQSSCVFRLKKTREAVGSKYLRIHNDLVASVSSELNYKRFRQRVLSASPPLIPFPGIYQGDLMFVDTYIKDRLEGGLVNVQKQQKVANIVLELQAYQRTPYNLEPVPEIQEYIRGYAALTDDAAYAASLACEPRVGGGGGGGGGA
ncbi:hypothetical protein HK405_007407, partial [Cladochytrium tenue]